MAVAQTQGLSDYIHIKLQDSLTGTENICKVCTQCQASSEVWEDFTCHWVVLTTHMVPHYSAISYCDSKESWQPNLSSQIVLDHFKLVEHEFVGEDSKKRHQLEICKEQHSSLLMEFDSFSQFQRWNESLLRISNCVYTEIIRSPAHPQREKQYVIEMSPSIIRFYKPDNQDGDPEFFWKAELVRRAVYDQKVGKLEVEIGRRGDNWDKYSLIGLNIKQFYNYLRERYQEYSTLGKNVSGAANKGDISLRRARTLSPAILSSLHSKSECRLVDLAADSSQPPPRQCYSPMPNSSSFRLEPDPPPLPPRPLKLSRSPSLFYPSNRPSISSRRRTSEGGVAINLLSGAESVKPPPLPPPPLPPRPLFTFEVQPEVNAQNGTQEDDDDNAVYIDIIGSKSDSDPVYI